MNAGTGGRNRPTDIWKLDRARGGGLVFHCGIHQLNLIRHYAGKIRTIQAFRPGKNPLAFYPDDVPGNATLMISTEQGVTVNFQIFHDRAATWYREKNYSPDYAHAPGHEFNISVVGKNLLLLSLLCFALFAGCRQKQYVVRYKERVGLPIFHYLMGNKSILLDHGNDHYKGLQIYQDDDLIFQITVDVDYDYIHHTKKVSYEVESRYLFQILVSDELSVLEVERDLDLSDLPSGTYSFFAVYAIRDASKLRPPDLKNAE